ncbi:hypothetical protein [Algoriphagus aquimarinus]|uniref:hypothetical protein n=1 Tax=Algoriphagus aquimarinus TaxID=237018 RepID=UPI0030D74BAC|tara:strand:+ start:168875 stop:169519 length:645 start_codon:yes stop_codon:yes gene_type:complete
MKKLLTQIVAVFLWLSASGVSAHQPDISSFTIIEAQPGIWMLQLNASMTAFQYEVRNAYGEDSYASPEEFNQLLLDYLKKQIVIQINDEEVTLEKGLVRLGHATTVAFELSGVPEEIEEVFVRNYGFKNINKSQVIFSIIKEGMEKEQFLLNGENDFQLHLSLTEDQLLLPETPWISNRILLILALTGFGALGVLAYKRTSRKIFLGSESLSNA